jgi:hypothetical protein
MWPPGSRLLTGAVSTTSTTPPDVTVGSLSVAGLVLFCRPLGSITAYSIGELP